MALKLSVGLSKKVGQPDYGSLGASCGVEVELDPSLLRDDLDGFHERVKDAFIACQQAVNDELSRLRVQPTLEPRPSHANGHAGTNGNAHRMSTSPPSRTRPSDGATTNQVRAIRAIARRAGVDLDAMLANDFGMTRPDDLSRSDASALIDRLKALSDA